MTRIESFVSAFRADAKDGEVIKQIEIPLIQRDYAQGRRGAKVDEIRATFLDVLHSALAGPSAEPLSLDFVYGEIDELGTFEPLDGQQRLTTLFLLHWYLAARAGMLEPSASWTKFSYATRQSARRFCARLVQATPPEDVVTLSKWVVDQSWYLFTWRHDPSIEAMLVMLDAIQTRFGDLDARAAWDRLADDDAPAVTFHLLPLPDMGSAEDLYIKMNSRGKPLTDFENFKAHFEKTIEHSSRATEFAERIDVAWSNLLWSVKDNEDDVIDDEFLRYLDFVTDVCVWSDPKLSTRGGLTATQSTERVFGATNALRDQHLDYLFDAFDIWVDRDIDETFEKLFAGLPLFFRRGGSNLFEACCQNYGSGGSTRDFGLGQTLMLHAVVLHLIHQSEDFERRARILRNLIEGSQYEIRYDRMSRLVNLTRELILDGVIPASSLGFSYPQISDELAKAEFRDAHPNDTAALDGLEDHPRLRGSLTSFPLDAGRIAPRAEAFRRLFDASNLWRDAAGALLTFGDYFWVRGRTQVARSFQFAATDPAYADVWRTLLTGATRDELESTAVPWAAFLDTLADSTAPLDSTIDKLRTDWLAEREADRLFDWRYYMVKYRGMRDGGSGIYVTVGGALGYSLCNLKGGKERMSSWYRDPYLLSLWEELGRPGRVEDPWFTGYETDGRYLRLTASATGVRAVHNGFYLSAPEGESRRSTFREVLAQFGGNEYVQIPQRDVAGERVDTQDRILLGTGLIRAMLEKGL